MPSLNTLLKEIRTQNYKKITAIHIIKVILDSYKTDGLLVNKMTSDVEANQQIFDTGFAQPTLNKFPRLFRNFSKAMKQTFVRILKPH